MITDILQIMIVKQINYLQVLLRKNWVLLLLFGLYLMIFLWQDTITNLLVNQEIQILLGESIYKGWLGLVDYLSAHVLLCLIPAFFIAGGINTLIDSQTILKYLSGKTKKWLSYIIASVGGFFIEVCSCTILPLFAGIWKKGAGLGIATTFLYAGPAINIVTFILTGQKLGWDFGIVRLILSITFAISVGLIMEVIFRKENTTKGNVIFGTKKQFSLNGKQNKIFWINLFAILIIGTAPIDMNLKYLLITILVTLQIIISFLWLSKEDRSAWWNETIKFTTDIIPLLLVGVFLSSAITNVIPQNEFQQLLGQNTIFTNLIAVIFGSLVYFPALVEVPVAESFLKLGMDKGPLMAYLLADPVLSLQGLLVISKLIGTKKTLVYAGSIIILTTIAGFIFGILF